MNLSLEKDWILAFDTSTFMVTAGIINDTNPRLFYEWRGYLKLNYTETLLQRIDLLLKEQNLSYNHLKGVFISIGPGSFTGLRAGIATAKGLCFSLNIPLIGISSIQIRAMSVGRFIQDKSICSLTIARRGYFYWGIFKFNDSEIVTEKEESISSTEEIINWLKDYKKESIVVVEDIKEYENCFSQLSSLRVIEAEPDITSIYILGKQRLIKNEQLNIDCSEPMYIYTPSFKKLDRNNMRSF